MSGIWVVLVGVLALDLGFARAPGPLPGRLKSLEGDVFEIYRVGIKSYTRLICFSGKGNKAAIMYEDVVQR